MTERISKDADFAMQNRKRVPVTRSEPTARSWSHRNQKLSQGNGQSQHFLAFSLSEVALFRKNRRKHVLFEKGPTCQKLRFRLLRTWGFLLRSCVLACSLPPLVVFSLRWSIPLTLQKGLAQQELHESRVVHLITAEVRKRRQTCGPRACRTLHTQLRRPRILRDSWPPSTQELSVFCARRPTRGCDEGLRTAQRRRSSARVPATSGAVAPVAVWRLQRRVQHPSRHRPLRSSAKVTQKGNAFGLRHLVVVVVVRTVNNEDVSDHVNACMQLIKMDQCQCTGPFGWTDQRLQCEQRQPCRPLGSCVRGHTQKERV